jgi:hypothetical protein
MNVGLDEGFAFSGRFSVRTEGTPDVSEIFSVMKPAVPGKQYVLTAVVMTDGTDGASSMGLLFWKSGTKEGADWPRVQMPPDQPWWTPVEGVFTCPADKDEMQVGIDTRYAKGRTWIDDVSLKAVGSDVELAENGSFDR